MPKFGSIVNANTGEALVEMHGPPNALSADADLLSQSLYGLSELVIRGLFPEQRGPGFGGPFGYGVEFQNDVFLLHPYCWCEKEDCLWCAGCSCPDGDVESFLDGHPIADWSAKNSKLVAELPYKVADYGTPEYAQAMRLFDASIEERNRRLRTFYPARIHSCQPAGLMENRSRSESSKPRQRAPNFWHKASGVKVWWYKYIGRGMELNREDLTGEQWGCILQECINSVPQEARILAEREQEHERTPEYQAARDAGMKAMFAAMDALLAAQVPCWECSEAGAGRTANGELRGGSFMSGKHGCVAKTTHKADGTCTNCGHINTEEEALALEARATANAEQMRQAFQRSPQHGAAKDSSEPS